MKSVSLILLILCGCVFLNNCKPKEKTPKEKLVDFAVNDLVKRLKSPSSFILDSTKIQISMFPEEYKNGEEKFVQIYYQSENVFGVLLQGFTIYDILADTNGGFKVLNIETYGSKAEYDEKLLDEIMEMYHSR